MKMIYCLLTIVQVLKHEAIQDFFCRLFYFRKSFISNNNLLDRARAFYIRNIIPKISLVLAFLFTTAVFATPTDDLLDAALNGDLKKAEVAIKAGADVNGRLNGSAEFPEYKKNNRSYSEDSTALHLASGEGHLEIAKLLIENKAEVNEADWDTGYTAIIYASKNGHLEIVKLLIENKAGVNAKSNDGYTALIVASEKGHLEIIKELIANKADVDSFKKDNKILIFLALEKEQWDAAELLSPMSFQFLKQENREEDIYDFFRFLSLMQRFSDEKRIALVNTLISHWENEKAFQTDIHATLLWFFYALTKSEKADQSFTKTKLVGIGKFLYIKPLHANIYYLLAKFYSIHKDFEQADQFLSLAIENSETHLVLQSEDKDFSFLRNTSMEKRKGILFQIEWEKKNPKLLIQTGHTDKISNMTYSPDGKTLATASRDHTAKIWSIDGKLLHTLKGHTYQINHIAYSLDGKTVATVSDDGKAKIWSIDGKLLHTLEGHTDRVTYIIYSPDGKTIVTSSWDHTVKIWSLDGKLLHTLRGNTSYLNHKMLSPDGKTIATEDNYTVKIWSLDGKLLHTLEGHTGRVTYIIYSPDGKTIATASRDNTARIWSIDGELLYTLEGHTSNVIIAYSPDGKMVTTAAGLNLGDDNTAKIWNLLDGKLLHTLEHTSYVDYMAYSPDGKTIATASDKTAKIWSLLDGKPLHTLEHVDYIAYSPDGKTIATTSDKTAKIWSLDGKLKYTMEGHTSDIKTVYSPDEKTVATTSDRFANIWNLDGKLLHTLEGHTDKISHITYSPDGKTLATASRDHTAKIWSIEGKLLYTLEGHTNEIFHITYSPDGKTLATASRDYTAKIWSIEGKLLHTLKGHTGMVDYIVYSPDGKTVATASFDYTVKIWSLLNGKMLHTLRHSGYVRYIVYSPDGETVATAAGHRDRDRDSGDWRDDKTAKIWNLDGKLLHTLEGHTSYVKHIAYSPDRKTVATASRDSTAKIWNLDGKLLHTLEGHTGDIIHITYSPDGKYLITGSRDNKAIVWDLSNLGSKRNMSIVHKLKSHSGWINSMRFFQDEKILATSSEDNTIKYWDWKNGILLATQIFFKDNSSILHTPDNYYMVANDSILKYITFKKENKIYDFDQFDLKFNRPDIIMDRMRGLFLHKQEKDESDETYKDRVHDYDNKITLYKNYYEHRIKQNGFTPEQLSGENKIHAPEITEVKVNNVDVDSKSFDSKTKNKKVKLSFAIEDEKDSNLDIVGYKVFVQGVPLHGQFIKKFSTPEKRKTVEEEITLSTLADVGDSVGSNTIEISGYTSDGIESSKQKIYLNYENQDLNKKGNLYLVTLGTEKYKSGGSSDLNDLTYSIDDAEDLQKLFKDKNINEKSYKSIIPIFLKDGEITRVGANKIRDALSKSEVDDTVIFFISGHGVRADTSVSVADAIAKEFGITQSIGEPSNKKDHLNVYYYMTSNSSTKEPWKNGIPMESFRFALDGIQARQKILLIDTCQSGDKIDLTGYKPSKQRIDEIRNLRASFKNKEMEKGITRVRGNDEEEELSSSEKYFRSLAYEWELRELSKMFPELRRGTGTIEISAASGTQSALESNKWKNGAFTFTIKEAIIGGKAKDGEDITAKSLRKYILDRVERLTEGRQIPMVTRDISGRDFRITK